ncbi:hypothetical protein [Paenibacillus sp. YPG26]|uniref:hypothetical protein n=1 Tax=Paenibacillus sp. YPG26 TaxID=2878915 RepID=UPI00203F3C87|nr:hypothetical protein [Paenibacillus sp. YPG26]USB32986.1 hypothetical protein LDO05_17330 [Paenibacillus sp. YPG26]
MRSLSKPKKIAAWTVILLLIFGSWGGNIWYYRSMQLAEPLFLNSYTTLNATEGESIKLVYLENKYGTKKVTGIQIDELPQLSFIFSEGNSGTYHKEIKAFGGFKSQEQGPVIKEPITIKEATVYYSEGPPRKVPIGELQVLPASQANVVEFYSSSASSGGSGFTNGTMLQSAELERIDFTFSDRLKPYLQLELEDQPIESLEYPVSLQKGDRLSISYRWEVPEHDPVAYANYEPQCRLEFRLKDGRKVTQTFIINGNLNLSEEQMKRLVRSEGGLK